MDKKYYDLIISLIKKHRKYPGLEAILDDIANDVYEHSKVVIGTVTNEEIIESYFNKVISTSIITVPKKMNFNTRARHRIISTIIPESTTAVIEEELKTADLTTPEIITPEETVFIKQEQEQEQEQEQDFLPENIITPEELEITNDTEILEETLPTETNFEESANTDSQENENDENISEQTEAEINVDKSLVDKMINDSTKATVEEFKESNANFEALDDLFVKEEEKEDNNTEYFEEISKTNLELTETIDNTDELEFENEAEENNDEIFVEEINSETPIITEEEEEEEEEESFINSETDEENIIDEINTDEEFSSQIDENIEGLVELEIEETETEDALSLDVNEEVDFQDFSENTDEIVLEFQEEEEEENIIDEQKSDEPNNEFQNIDYSCFDYNPNDLDIDTEDIFLALKEIQKDYNNTDIIDICELKFVQKKSVSEIAEQIGLSKSDVIEILNDISEAIKE